jgi:hypothetical protein
MSSQGDPTVANPDRTRVDDVDDLPEDHLPEDQLPRDGGKARETGQGNDPHDQPWPAVAEEVKQAVEDADGPLA